MFEIRAMDLGLRNDRLVFAGLSPVDTVAQVVAYLLVEYGLSLPESHMIFREGGEARWVLSSGNGDGYPAVDLCPEAPSVTHNAILQHLRDGVPIYRGT